MYKCFWRRPQINSYLYTDRYYFLEFLHAAAVGGFSTVRVILVNK